MFCSLNLICEAKVVVIYLGLQVANYTRLCIFHLLVDLTYEVIQII